MKRILLIWLSLVMVLPAYAADSIKVISDRSDFHLRSVIEQYGKDAGVKVEILYLKEGLLARLQSRREADVVIVSNSSEIIMADELGLLASLPKKFNRPDIDPKFFGKKGNWFNMSYRIRAIIVKKGEADYPKTYEELANSKYAGKICLRPLNHVYNLELVSYMLAKHGQEYTAKWLKGLKNNLARKPAGNDRAQAKAIHDGECSIAVVNTYYMGLMLQNIEQRSWAEKVNLLLPNQEGDGALAMRSAVGITKAGQDKPAVAMFLDYLMSPIIQQYLSSTNFEYPAVGRTSSPVVESFGAFQKIKSSDIKLSLISQEAVAKQMPAALKLITSLE
jgi:iron(III) transport system substrate-binding protein